MDADPLPAWPALPHHLDMRWMLDVPGVVGFALSIVDAKADPHRRQAAIGRGSVIRPRGGSSGSHIRVAADRVTIWCAIRTKSTLAAPWCVIAVGLRIRCSPPTAQDPCIWVSRGLDAARVILGHKSPSITEVYAEIDAAKAVKIMAKVG